MYGNIDIKTRPLKLAYLVEPGNAEQVRESMRLCSSLWGGVYSPIIPLYSRTPASWKEEILQTPPAKDVILGYLEAFDPDVLVQLSEELPSYISEKGLQIIKPEDIWRDLDVRNKIYPNYGLGVFEVLEDIYNIKFKYKAKYPVKVIFPNLPIRLGLFWTSLFGEIHSKILDILKEHFFEPLEIEIIDFKINNLSELMKEGVLFPRRITNHEINTYKTNANYMSDACVFYLDATRIDDIIDYWNLRALGREVMPVPKQLESNKELREIVIEFLKYHRVHLQHNPEVCSQASIIRGRSCSPDEIKEFTSKLKITKEADDISNSPFFALQHWFPRIWDEGARGHDAAPYDIYGNEEQSVDISDTKDFKIRFNSLLPKFADKHVYHNTPRCANEISFRIFESDEFLAEAFPKSSGNNFVRAISGIMSLRGEWRVGKKGLVKIVRDKFPETYVVPTSERVFFAWLEDLGWKPKLSPPGLLAKQIVKTVKGNISILKNESLLGLLEHMNGGTVNSDGSPVSINNINQERDLEVGHVKNRLLGTERGERIYSYLTERGIFKLGARVQCPNCTRKSWYRLEDIKDSMNCPRCTNSFGAVGTVDSSTWSYKTTGPFSVPKYAEGAYSVLLTLTFFHHYGFLSFRITPTFSFLAESSNQTFLEADLAFFWQESRFSGNQDGVLFCECKTYNLFKKEDYIRMNYLAEKFPGAVLVFSTLRKSLNQDEIEEMTKIAKKGRKHWKFGGPINPVLILTGNELLHDLSPPNCWDKETKKKV